MGTKRLSVPGRAPWGPPRFHPHTCPSSPQTQQSKFVNWQVDGEYRGSDFTAAVTLGNPDVLVGSGKRHGAWWGWGGGIKPQSQLCQQIHFFRWPSSTIQETVTGRCDLRTQNIKPVALLGRKQVQVPALPLA